MIRRTFLTVLGQLLSIAFFLTGNLVFSGCSIKTEKATISGRVADDEKGIAGVVVSDGYETTLTDQQGNYHLPIHPEAEFVFISLPSGYKIPHTEGIAKFFEPLDFSKQKQKINFRLQENELDDMHHAFVVWADPQVKTESDVSRMMNEPVPDVAAHLKTLGNVPVHGITCGDIVFDQFHLYPEYKMAVSQMKIPFFQVVGNHDIDYTAPSRKNSTKQFKEAFGPTYYSFNRGKIHYVVLNDVLFKGDDEAYKDKRRKYIGHVSAEQLQWLKKDMQYIPAGSTVIVALHIPTYEITFLKSAVRTEFETATVGNRDELYKLLEPYRVHIVSGHTHYNETAEHGNRMEHNHASVCNAWWIGNICTDGTPGGYGLYEVNGDSIRWYYKPTGFEPSYQFRVYPQGCSPERPDEIVANVWNYDKGWKVVWYEDGAPKGEMKRYLGYDPLAYENMFGEDVPDEKGSLEPTRTEHLFSAKPSAIANEIKVEVTDRFGNVYENTIKLK